MNSFAKILTSMLHAILSEDWSDYDQKKKSRAEDFDSTEWELNYLFEKIKNHYSEDTESLIKRAIFITSKELRSPCSRKKFISRTLENLEFLRH